MAATSIAWRALLPWVTLVGCAAGGAASRHDSIPPQVDRYETMERPGALLGGPDSAELAAAVARAAAPAGLALRGDGRLAQLARSFAEGCAPSPSGAQAAGLAAAARRLGLVDVELTLVCVSAAARAELPDALASALVARARAAGLTHYGAFAAPNAAGAVAVLSRRSLALEPIARRLQPGESLRVRGRLAGGYTDARVWVRGPDGEQSFPAGAGAELDVHLPITRAGCYALQIVAREGERRQTLAELTAVAGDAADGDCAAPRGTIGSVDLAELQRALAQRIVALRAAEGLPALASDARLSEQAAHARDDAAASGALGSGLALLAVAEGKDETALWDALVHDGSARAKLLNADVTHLGIAAATRSDGVRATVLVAQLAKPADVELASARVLEALNRNRAARSAVALRPDPTLTRVAASAARAFFEQPARTEQEIVAAANAELERFTLSYRRVAALALLVTDPLEAAALEPALDPEARAAGIAATGGIRGPRGERRIAVVIALGWDRER